MARALAGAIALVLLASLDALPLMAQVDDPNECDQLDESPDVIVGDIHQLMRHGNLNGISAYSIGTTSCNIGDCWLEWDRNTNRHPVIGQNMFRLKDGRFEQIGQSWLKHGFFAVSQSLCSTDCHSTDGSHLGVNCSDPYNADFNGLQQQLGPKSEVDPAKGDFIFPFTTRNQTGDVIYKRLQVHDVDLDPLLNSDASYFVEGQYVTADDSAAGNNENNVAHRPVIVTGSNGFFNIFLQTVNPTVQGPAVAAWGERQANVDQRTVDVAKDGRFVTGASVEALPDGFYRYEYAVQNLTSQRAAGSFAIPLPLGAVVRLAGFHDVDYHSGEPFDAADWAIDILPQLITFSTSSFGSNPLANALRWGTLYNFRFEADVPPVEGPLTLGLFQPGLPQSVTVMTLAPQVCVVDGICVPGENPCNCAVDCGAASPTEDTCDDGVDQDCDGKIDCLDLDCCADLACEDGVDQDEDGVAFCDCNDGDSNVWSSPGSVNDLEMVHHSSESTLNWPPPEDSGGASIVYDVLRSAFATEFGDGAICLESNAMATSAVDSEAPVSGRVFFYLVRSENECPFGEGDLGPASLNLSRQARSCP